MVYRTSRRRFVASAASLAGLLALGQAVAPAEAAPPKSEAREQAEYLIALLIDWERKAADPTGAEARHAASILASAARCLDFPIKCLDGSFLRDIKVA